MEDWFKFLFRFGPALSSRGRGGNHKIHGFVFNIHCSNFNVHRLFTIPSWFDWYSKNWCRCTCMLHIELHVSRSYDTFSYHDYLVISWLRCFFLLWLWLFRDFMITIYFPLMIFSSYRDFEFYLCNLRDFVFVIRRAYFFWYSSALILWCVCIFRHWSAVNILNVNHQILSFDQSLLHRRLPQSL